MKRNNVISVILGTLVIIGIIFASAFFFPSSVTFREFGFNEVSQLLTLLVLVSLFLERALKSLSLPGACRAKKSWRTRSRTMSASSPKSATCEMQSSSSRRGSSRPQRRR